VHNHFRHEIIHISEFMARPQKFLFSTFYRSDLVI